MLDNLKKCIGNFSIELGKQAVGKCMVPGMFDPKIPAKLVENTNRFSESMSRRNVSENIK